MCDDMISTAGTLCGAATLLRERGAKHIIAGATHGVFAGQAFERIEAAPFDEVIVTDTIPQNEVVPFSWNFSKNFAMGMLQPWRLFCLPLF